MRAGHVLMVVAILVTVSAASPAYGQGNGGPPAVVRAALPVDGSWNLFSWSMGPGVFNGEGPFTFMGPAVLDVTDIFIDGDPFEVIDGAVSLGMTSVPTDTGSSQPYPDLAFADPDWSSGTFNLGPGPHSITVRTIATAPGFPNGAAYLRATPSMPVAPGWMLALLAVAMVAGGTWIIRRSRPVGIA